MDMTASANISDIAPPLGQRAAADYLRQLLLQPGFYQETWRRYVGGGHHGVINQLAVMEVLAGHLRAVPRRPGDVGIAAYQLRETVARALTGRQLSRPALQLFIDAFQIRGEDAARLWKLWDGAPSARAISGRAAISANAEESIVAAFGRWRHQTLSMNEHIWVSSDGRIDQCHITQVVEAVEDDVDRVPFVCNSNLVELEVGHGCGGMTGEHKEIGENLTATEIILSRQLRRGETTSIEYWVAPGNRGQRAGACDSECRRAVVKRIENYEQRIEFHSEKLPSAVWWAQWDGIDGDVIARERAELDSQQAVQRYLRSVEKSVVGFYWTWPD